MERSYCTFTAMLQCRHCGGGLPMQGPMRTVRCAACQGDNELAAERVASYLYYAGARRARAVDEIKLTYQDGHACACGALIDFDKGDACRKCGLTVASFAPPPWLKEQLPALAQIYGAEQDPADRPADAAAQPVVAKGAAPVVFACPSCSGGLRIDADSARTVPCQFCSASVYLPDDLWRTLHPVKRVSPWTIAWDGDVLLRLQDIRSREQALADAAKPPVPPSTWLPGPPPRKPDERATAAGPASPRLAQDDRVAPAAPRRLVIVMAGVVAAAVVVWLLIGR